MPDHLRRFRVTIQEPQMVNLGNAWHVPANPEPLSSAGMRDPVFPTEPLGPVTVISGNQFQGGGAAGNQLQNGSAVLVRRQGEVAWSAVAMLFLGQVGNNKYYSAQIPVAGLRLGDVVAYYLRIPYDDHDTTFVHLAGDGATSATTGDEAAAQAAPFTFSVESRAVRGAWSDVFALPNVGIHATLLHTGEVLMWGRRDSPDQSLNSDPPSPLERGGPTPAAATCTPFLWNPSTRQSRPTPQPTLADGTGRNANLFCSGHALLTDGRLLVVGGHRTDSVGLDQSTVYDPATNAWTPGPRMAHGRWYPTAVTLADGGVVVFSGSYRGADDQTVNNVVPELWSTGAWTELAVFSDASGKDAMDLYPRVHAATDGLLYQVGALLQTWSLDLAGGGRWAKVAARAGGQRDYAPSVMYDVDRVVYIGGGNLPSANAEKIDLGAPAPAWSSAGSMQFPRRQHNATILADGSVLVTGGTRGGNADASTPQSFNDLDPGRPVHIAELWDPAGGTWTPLAAEAIDRCYHATAVLLPDATVLSAGSGEYIPNGTNAQNDPADSHRDAQIFSPPYLFKGDRPVITSAPGSITYGQPFDVATPQAATIAKVTLVRPSSVTHSFNAAQRILFLDHVQQGASLRVSAPAAATVCPPGHYMLFLVDGNGVPSVASFVLLNVPPALTPAASATIAPLATPIAAAAPAHVDVSARRQAVRASATGAEVTVGLTGTCPYGIAACWGGAHEALQRLSGVELVDPVADGEASTATVFMRGHVLPSLQVWREELRRIVDASYTLRGVELTLSGTLERHDGEISLLGHAGGPALPLAPMTPADKVQWDRTNGRQQPLEPDEAAAYARLVAESPATGATITVTGPLVQSETGQRLEVRRFTR